MSEYVRVAAGTPLTDEDRAQLRALAQKPDSEIDFSDIPERIYRDAGKVLPLEEHTITLRVDADVAAWLKAVAEEEAERINFILRRAAQRSKRVQGTNASVLEKAS
jgi:uncharacterized protein (DUF4415 family)